MVDLYPHQYEAAWNLDNGKVLTGGTGSGKSITAAYYYMQKEADADIYVITTARKRNDLDWEREFARFGIGKSPDATVAGGVLSVDSWNNIGKYADVEGAFFIFDEQRLVGSGQWVDKFLKIAKKNRWILLSATPGDNWLDWLPVFIANGFFKNRTEFKHEHVIYNTHAPFPKVDRYVGTGKLVRLRKQLIVEMPFVRHTRRIPHLVEVEYDKETFDLVLKERWNPWEQAPIKNLAGLFSVLRRVVYSHPSRLSSVKRLITQHPRLIVFYNFNYELELLRSLGPNVREAVPCVSPATTPLSCPPSGTTPTTSTSGVPAAAALSNWKTSPAATSTTPASGSVRRLAEWNGQLHQPIPLEGDWTYLVQYTAGAEGWNCTSTDATAFYSMPYSFKAWEQAHGRIDRINTLFKDLHYYTLMSQAPLELATKRALDSKKDFQESAFTDIKW